MRCFVALPLPPSAVKALLPALRELEGAPDVRPVAADRLHITLKFLGAVPDQRLPALCAVLKAVTPGRAPECRLGALGAFPSPRAARVVWAGVEDEGACGEWLARADPEFERVLGAPLETRPFRPHITLARAASRRGTAEIQRRLPQIPPPRKVTWIAEEAVLFSSALGPGGARYSDLARVAFDPLAG